MLTLGMRFLFLAGDLPLLGAPVETCKKKTNVRKLRDEELMKYSTLINQLTEKSMSSAAAKFEDLLLFFALRFLSKCVLRVF